MGPGLTGMVSVAWRILRGASVRSTERVIGAVSTPAGKERPPGTPVWALAVRVATQSAARGKRRDSDMREAPRSKFIVRFSVRVHAREGHGLDRLGTYASWWRGARYQVLC